MQRGAPRGSSSLFLSPHASSSPPPRLCFLRPSNPCKESEIGRGVLPMDVCTHRWIDRTIFTIPPSSFALRTALPSRSPCLLVAIEITRKAGEGHRGTERSPRALSLLSLFLSRRVYSQSPVCSFIYEIADEKERAWRGDGGRKRNGD